MINKPAIRKWIKRLRSGKDKQTRGVLKNSRSGGMCCLGVACKVAGITLTKSVELNYNAPANYSAMRDFYGLDDLTTNVLVEKNDRSHWNFKKIAAYLEKTYLKN